MSSSTKDLDPAFQGAGQKLGIEIWRIENFQPVPLPKSDHGKFYSGDSYIILQTGPGKGGAYSCDIHFWLGKDTSQDEAGTAAIKTVELDASLGGKAVQHREVQGHESDKFLSYFKPCIIPLEGGVSSGFKKPEEEEFETRLYVCKGKRAVKLKQVPFARSSLNHDDVFILDTKDKIYQFNGENSNIQERAKALEVIQFLKDTYHAGTCEVAIVDDGKLQAESDSGEFWVLFGGFAPLGRKAASDDDIVAEATPAKPYSIVEGQVNPLEGELSKGMLENSKCYFLDCGNEIFLWFGRATQVEERKSACQVADDFVTSQSRPKATRITRVIQGYEPHTFKSHFDSWPTGSATPAVEEGRGRVAAFLKQQGVGAKKGATKGAVVNEEVPPLLQAGGKIQVWRIDGSAKTSVPKEDIGKFYSGDCYITLYAYHSSDKKEDYFLCWWIGKDSIEEERKTASQLANTMFNSLKGRPVLGRIFEGREPPQFLALFQPMIVLKGGLSSGYKKLLEAKELYDVTYAADGVALFRVSGTSSHNSRAVQVDTVATSLNSYECYVLQTGNSIFIWQGNQSSFEQQQLAVKVAEIVKPGGPLKHAKEGTENSTFWSALGGKENYTSNQSSQSIVRDPHLYAFSVNKGKFQVEEIFNFTQDDLLTEDMLILDTHAEVIVWVGQSVDQKENQKAFEVGEKYVGLATALEGLPPKVPLYKISEGYEPCFFTTYFSWDQTKATVPGNSFQKKVAILFGLGHPAKNANRTNGSNQGGNTQRASALAALSSAFNPSSDDRQFSSPTKSNGSNQGGTTQRASALAALSSAFNSPSEKRSASPRPSSGTSQGSQRAAALAALSPSLTAEKKSGTPDASPARIGRSPLVFSPAASAESRTPPSHVVEGSKGVVADSREPATETIQTNEEQSDSKLQENQKENTFESSPSTFSYEQLRSKSDDPVTGIDFKHREAYLSDEEFQTVFGMTKKEFCKLPGWKKDMQKKKHDLF